MSNESFFDMPPDWEKHWQGMPEFCQHNLAPYRTLLVHFRNPEDRKSFFQLVGQKETPKTRFIWHPRGVREPLCNRVYVSEPIVNPRYPIFVPSKGRWKTCYTQHALEEIGVPYKTVVEPQEYKDYVKALGPEKVIVLPHRDKGLVVTRNWIWDYASKSGVPWFWTIDDNITFFARMCNNLEHRVLCGSIFRAAEDFVEQYENVVLAGFQYCMFALRKVVFPPYYLNTRIFSNMLIKTEARDKHGNQFRNEGFFNDDSDLCIRVLKDGQCTVLFNCFRVKKLRTMTVEGGMTPYYQGDGRYRMAKELYDKHPDIVKITQKWGRWQHHVDYGRFRRNKLRLKESAFVRPGVDNYGMYLKHMDE